MANLRVNKITTGTADYQGSIYASGTSAYLLTTTTAPGTDDFTIECWINSDNASGTNQEGVFGINAQAGGFQSGSSNQIRLAQGRDGAGGQNGGLEVNLNGTYVGTPDGEDIIQEGTWHHIAVTRASGTLKIWVDGVEKASGSAAGDVTGTTFVTGYYDGNYTYQGYMSNFRYRKGTAYYTTTFTPPTGPLERTSDTELLFAQSVNNASNGYSSAIHGGTTDIMQVFGNVTANTSAPTLTTSSSVGVVFDGYTKINSPGVMYFPTGDTSQRGRGVGLYGGGTTPSTDPTAQIASILIQSMGNSFDWGDLSVARYPGGTGASATRGIWAGGATPTRLNTIDYVTIATTGTAQDFGDSQNVNNYSAGASNQTRMVNAGGDTPTIINVMDLITIATTGNASDFGDLTVARVGLAEGASPTRGVFAGGWTAVPTYTPNDTIDYVTIATAGNAADFGNLTSARRSVSGGSSQTRAIFMGGMTGNHPSATEVNTMDYVTIATTGDAVDFGDMTATIRDRGDMMSNSIRTCAAGGYDSPATVNTIDMVTIATTGNAVDFGDTVIPVYSPSGLSDSHGGLS